MIVHQNIADLIRSDALASGRLIDVTDRAQLIGWRLPVAITRNVEALTATPCGMHEQPGQTEIERLHQILFVAMLRIRNSPPAVDEIDFSVPLRDDSGPNVFPLRAICGRGDQWEPVVTIIKLGE